MGRFVIAAYKPKPGQEAALAHVVERNWRVLRAEDLVTARPRYAMQAADGVIIEVFEWRSPQAVEAAHSNAAVAAIWAEFDAVCEHVPLASLTESQQMFAEFDALGFS